MLGKLLQFGRRRTKSRYVDDKAVDDFARVAKEQGLYNDKRLVELLKSDEDPAGNITRPLLPLDRVVPRRPEDALAGRLL